MFHLNFDSNFHEYTLIPIYILHTNTYRNLYASHFRSAYFIYHFASLLDLLHWNWMQLLHCEYELINSYNCPVIVFFVCRLFFFLSRAAYMANLVFARVRAIQNCLDIICLHFPVWNYVIYSTWIAYARMPKMDIHIWFCLPIFENFIACYSFFSPSFMLSFVPYELVETRTCVCSAPFCNSNKFSFNTSFIFILTAVT